MKILLIYPYFIERRIHIEDVSAPPMGIYHVAAMLRQHGYDVDILNWYDMQGGKVGIEAELKSRRPNIIGFSILHANRWGGLDIADLAKRIDPKVITVFGGIGATFLWAHLLAHFKQVDYVIIGEGEIPLLNLVHALADNATADARRIPGIAYRVDGRPTRSRCADPIVDLDRLPMPSRYYTYQHVSLTRGCPGNCRFCGSPRFWGRTVRFHSPKYFVDQLEQLTGKGVRFFYFSDDTFTVRRQTAIDICRDIIDRGLNIVWQAISRVDMVDESVLYWMRRAGCCQVSYGVESGCADIRRRVFNKSFSDRQIENAFRLTHRYGLMPRAYFIYGSPGESWRTIEASIDLMQRIKPLSAIFYILDIFPGTALYEAYQKATGATDDIWLNRVEDLPYFETDPRLNPELVMAFGQRLRAAFYAGLPSFIDDLELADIADLYPLHADFLSRLAMTFDHGDYAAVEQIKNKPHLAETLYRRALAYHPDARAYLGLAISRQKAGRHDDAIRILSEGIGQFPRDRHLSVCLAVSYMNSGLFERALEHLLPFENLPETRLMIADCYRELNQPDKAAVYLDTAPSSSQ